MKKLLLDSVPGDQLCTLLQPYLNGAFKITPEFRRTLNQEMLDLFTAAPGMAVRLVVSTELHTRAPDLAGSILSRAYLRTDNANARNYLRQAALKYSLHKFLPQDPTESRNPTLTASQQHSLSVLRAMAEAYFSGVTHGSLNLRFNPLIVGPSGVGKTFLVQQLGQELGLPVLKLTAGDWMVMGVRNGTPTFATIQRYLNQHEKFIIALDELDKHRSGEVSAWSMAMLTELFGLLDRNFHYAGEAGQAWTAQHTLRLKKNVFIVGSGTWQEVWRNQVARSVGFNAQENAFNFAQQARQSRLIPEELINRFNDRWLVLENYTAADFQMLANQHGLPSPEFDAEAAEASQLNFRYLESFAAEMEINRRLNAEPQKISAC